MPSVETKRLDMSELSKKYDINYKSFRESVKLLNQLGYLQLDRYFSNSRYYSVTEKGKSFAEELSVLYHAYIEKKTSE